MIDVVFKITELYLSQYSGCPTEPIVFTFFAVRIVEKKPVVSFLCQRPLSSRDFVSTTVLCSFFSVCLSSRKRLGVVALLKESAIEEVDVQNIDEINCCSDMLSFY